MYNINFNMGGKKSVIDNRVIIYENYENYNNFNMDDICESLDLREYLPGITNQKDDASCVEHTIVNMLEYYIYIDSLIYNEYELPKEIDGRIISSKFIYNIKNNEKIDNKKLISPLECFKILKNIGTCLEVDYKIKNIKTINCMYKENISIFKINKYAKILTIIGAKIALNNDGPVLISLPVYHFEVQFWNKNINIQNVLGIQTVTIIGYNDHGFIIRNSWGKKWGIDGYCIYPYDDWNIIEESWVIINNNRKYNYQNIKNKLSNIEKNKNLKEIDNYYEKNKLYIILKNFFNIFTCNLFKKKNEIF